jgi:hypothetical protein
VLEQVLEGDVALAVVVEVVEEEGGARCGVELGQVVPLHQRHVDADGLRQQSQVELHVDCDCGRVEAVLGSEGAVGFLEEGGVVGGDAQHAPREDALIDGVLNGVLCIGPVVGCEHQGGQQQQGDYNSHNQ